MRGKAGYHPFNDAVAASRTEVATRSEMQKGRPARRPFLCRLDPLAQVSTDWLQRKGKKPWRTVTPVSGAIQQENRQLGLMTRKALMALAEPCLPVDRLSVPAAQVAGTDRRTEVQATERIGRRPWPLASAPP